MTELPVHFAKFSNGNCWTSGFDSCREWQLRTDLQRLGIPTVLDSLVNMMKIGTARGTFDIAHRALGIGHSRVERCGSMG